MISRKNYFAIAAVMFIVFFLFQFSQVLKETGNNYDSNTYAEIYIPDKHVFDSKTVQGGEALIEEWGDNGYVGFLGRKETPIGSIVSQWVTYTKRNILYMNNVYKLDMEAYGKPEAVIIDSRYVDFDKETSVLRSFVDAGVSLVFCNIPTPSYIRSNKELMGLLGIQTVMKDSTRVEGIRLFPGFLLGGETIYQPTNEAEESRQDFDLDIPWYITLGGTKTYMVGMMEEELKDHPDKNEYFPAIIWRNSLGPAQVFVVNADFMETTAGIGVLSSMIYELSDYQIYPIVNAQNTFLVGFPLMAEENAAPLYAKYNRGVDAFQKDIIWPTLVSLMEKEKLTFTCLLSTKYNYKDASQASTEIFSDYVGTLNARAAEIGVSLYYSGLPNLSLKLKEDNYYFSKIKSGFYATSAFVPLNEIDSISEYLDDDELNHLQTIATDHDVMRPILSYYNDDITMQCLTSDTRHFSYKDDLMLKSVETALAYNNAKLNITRILWPEDPEDSWEILYDDMSSSLDTYWKPFRTFEGTTLTQADRRVRTFLNIYCTSEREEGVIHLKVEGSDGETCFFMLRIHTDKVTSVTGGSYKLIEDGAYLVEVNGTEADIFIESLEDQAIIK